MKFRYIKFPTTDPKRKWISRPLIPIQIIGPKGKWEGYALIDSGADRSLFHFEIGEIIGLDVLKGKIEYFSGIFDNHRIKFERDREIIEITPVK